MYSPLMSDVRISSKLATLLISSYVVTDHNDDRRMHDDCIIFAVWLGSTYVLVGLLYYVDRTVKVQARQPEL